MQGLMMDYPLTVTMVIERAQYDVSSLRCCPCGGAALARSVIEGFGRKFGASVVHASLSAGFAAPLRTPRFAPQRNRASFPH
jgi:hypothetical protein